MDTKEHKTSLVMVGACAIDTILSVPHFPEPDSKLRATSLTKRRGGNTPNSLEVLQQLVHHTHDKGILSDRETTHVELYLIATLPSRYCTQIEFITSSFNKSLSSNVKLDHCIYRADAQEPVSSYIISDQATSSRTIINHNALLEMTFEEFIANSVDLLKLKGSLWFHFEGRIPETTIACMQYVRSQREGGLKISVELEKPGRPGLQELAYEADLIFYSKAWAEGEGHASAEACLRAQVDLMTARNLRSKTLICTWGELGASAAMLEHGQIQGDWIQHSPAYKSEHMPIVDTTGAGDTFIAGILFGCMCRNEDGQESWTLQRQLDFANGLAGRKILQDGFEGLGEQSLDMIETFDSAKR